MKIFLISDTHGNLKKVYEVFNKLNDIDLIIHCGDYMRDAEIIGETLNVPVTAVNGNCDGARTAEHKIVTTPAGDILVTHGHMEGAGFDNLRLLYAAEENGCTAVCFGHTHCPVCEEMNGVYLINPGSLSRPRDGSNGSYAVIHATEEEFYCNIIYYDTVCGPDKKKQSHGGFIRGILNYSDRF